MAIYVNTDNSNPTNKLFNASKVGKSAAAVEKGMQQAVIEFLGTQPDFTTTTSGKGYSLRMKVVAETAGRATKYSVPIEIIRYPSSAAKGGKGEEMVPIAVKLGSATLQGASEADLVDAIGELTKSDVKASLGVMRVDMARR